MLANNRHQHQAEPLCMFPFQARTSGFPIGSTQLTREVNGGTFLCGLKSPFVLSGVEMRRAHMGSPLCTGVALLQRMSYFNPGLPTRRNSTRISTRCEGRYLHSEPGRQNPRTGCIALIGLRTMSATKFRRRRSNWHGPPPQDFLSACP